MCEMMRHSGLQYTWETTHIAVISWWWWWLRLAMFAILLQNDEHLQVPNTFLAIHCQRINIDPLIDICFLSLHCRACFQMTNCNILTLQSRTHKSTRSTISEPFRGHNTVRLALLSINNCNPMVVGKSSCVAVSRLWAVWTVCFIDRAMWKATT